MNKTMKTLINEFLDGSIEGITGSGSSPGNLKIKGDQLIHFSTPIFERMENYYILNMTRYSIQTGRLQKLIMELVPEKNIVVVLKVPMDYHGSLKNYMSEA